jgi:hypothetical protein
MGATEGNAATARRYPGAGVQVERVALGTA